MFQYLTPQAMLQEFFAILANLQHNGSKLNMGGANFRTIHSVRYSVIYGILYIARLYNSIPLHSKFHLTAICHTFDIPFDMHLTNAYNIL
jgi:hypothetical protein